ncbi:MAG: preprotein translocase subunit YajC [Muribaculaceae bacterium]|nr:preprotein translocase subunit YajC [Muribaculaceae bacterium]
MQLSTILLQQQGQSGWSGMVMILVMIVIFYFFMIRPQSKKQKEIKKAREAMTKGDKVVTAGGIFGTVKSINTADNTVMMEIAQGVTIKVSREQIFPAGVEKAQKNDAKKEEEPKQK